MKSRIGIAVGTLVALGVPTAVFGQDTPPFQRPLQTSDEITLTLSGFTRIAHYIRDGAVEESRGGLGGTPAATSSDPFMLGEFSLRLDIAWRDRIRAAVEVATRPYLNGADLPLATDGISPILRQAYLDIDSTFRLGAFDYAWRCRPHDEPFFLDVARSEAFFPATNGVRDLNHAAGILFKYKAHDFVQFEAVAMVVREGGSPSADENLGAVFLNFPASERTAFFAGVAAVAGPGDDVVTTFALAGDGYFGAFREVELFGEGYFQSKGDVGIQAGVRWFRDGIWAEGAVAYRSEDFRSYENQNRFLIVEDAEFGLDWDTNLLTVRGTFSHPLGTELEGRLDLGWFHLPDDVASESNLGVELDVRLSWNPSGAVTGSLRGAVLTGSDVVDALSADAPRSAWGFAAEIKVSW